MRITERTALTVFLDNPSTQLTTRQQGHNDETTSHRTHPDSSHRPTRICRAAGPRADRVGRHLGDRRRQGRLADGCCSLATRSRGGTLARSRSILAGKAYCARLTTSKCVSDPFFPDEVQLLLKQYRFAVIHFNNGLARLGIHGGAVPGWPATFDGDIQEARWRCETDLGHNNPGA